MSRRQDVMTFRLVKILSRIYDRGDRGVALAAFAKADVPLSVTLPTEWH